MSDKEHILCKYCNGAGGWHESMKLWHPCEYCDGQGGYFAEKGIDKNDSAPSPEAPEGANHMITERDS